MMTTTETRDWQMIVGGRETAAAGGETYERYSPATGDVVGRFPKGERSDVDQAVRAARDAFDEGPWPRMTGSDRASLLHALAVRLRMRNEEYARLESRQVGIPYGQISWLNHYCADVVDFFAGAARVGFGRSMATPDRGIALTLQEPVGVVGAITPWNFPLVLTIWKVAAALAAGCTIIVKPASQTPITIIELAKDLLEVGLPHGVCNVVTGPGAVLGEALVDHPGVDKIAFTGSTETGRKVMERASRTLKRVSLELGGKSPMIVTPDADPDTASDALLECFYNSGQQCNVPSRLVVAEPISDELVEALVQKVEKKTIGPEDDADYGPLVDDAQYERVTAYVDIARDEGAQILTGGKTSQGATLSPPFMAPVVLDRVSPGSRVVREEIFGPVLAVQRFKDLEEAVHTANAGDFGLAGGIFTSDLDAALLVARQLRAGTVWINTWNKTYPELPTGGFKNSGMGRELGLEGLEAYLEPKTIQMNPHRKER